jgi:hypothetical protein
MLNRGTAMPDIVVINQSTAISDDEIKKMLLAFDQQWNRDLKPVWGVEVATFTFVPKGTQPAAGAWWLVFLDDAVQADKVAFHDLTEEGLPISKVFAKTLLEDKVSVSVAATHELVEMAVDPWVNTAYQDSQGVFWAAEIGDPVEAGQYGYEIGDVLVTNFVTPDWFRHRQVGRTFDLKRHVSAPFQVLSEGYARRFDSQQSKWVQIDGAMVRPSKVADPCLGSRRERRHRQSMKLPELSTPDWREPR